MIDKSIHNYIENTTPSVQIAFNLGAEAVELSGIYPDKQNWYRKYGYSQRIDIINWGGEAVGRAGIKTIFIGLSFGICNKDEWRNF